MGGVDACFASSLEVASWMIETDRLYAARTGAPWASNATHEATAFTASCQAVSNRWRAAITAPDGFRRSLSLAAFCLHEDLQ